MVLDQYSQRHSILNHGNRLTCITHLGDLDISLVLLNIHLCYCILKISSTFRPSFVNYKKGCTRLAAASDIVYQLLAQGRWFSPGTPASATTKTGHHDIAEILLKVALNTKIQFILHLECYLLSPKRHIKYK